MSLDRARDAVGVAACAVFLLLTACNGGSSSDSGGSLPADTPVILISIDTLRADRLPMYGHKAVDTPHLDRFRADSVLFEHAYTHINQTLASHASMFTGLLPPEHGVRDNIGYVLADEQVTLADELGTAGWQTAGFVSTFVLRNGTGIEQGFDLWDDEIPMDSRLGLGGLQRDGFDTLSATQRWLRQRTDSDPSPFLFFHIYDPHAPYTPAEPFASRYSDRYDAEVAESDAIVGGLLDELREQGLYDDALIVLLSDHGEGLMDHGEMDHLVFIYREVLQVPLLIKLPGSRFAGSSVAAPAQTSDVFPTILSLLGLLEDSTSPAAQRARGTVEDATIDPARVLVDLDSGVDAHEQRARRVVFAESNYPRINLGWSDLTSTIQYPWHLIDGPDPELFDLANDPGETRNVLLDQRREFRALRAAIEGIEREITAGADVDAQTAARLASLGYVSGGGATAGDGELADPKTKIGVLEDLGKAAAAFESGRIEESIALYRRILDLEPDMAVVQQQFARALRGGGYIEEAIAAFRRAFELSGNSPSIAISLADAYLEFGDLEAAREHAKFAEGQHDQVAHLLARIALRSNDIDEMARQMKVAMENRGERIAPLVTQMALRVQQERHDDALQVFDQVIREYGNRNDPNAITGLYFHHGSALAGLQRFDEAESSYRREIELNPGTLEAYGHLAFILYGTNRDREAVRTLQLLTERNDTPGGYLIAARTFAFINDMPTGERLLREARRRWPDDQGLADTKLEALAPPG